MLEDWRARKNMKKIGIEVIDLPELDDLDEDNKIEIDDKVDSKDGNGVFKKIDSKLTSLGSRFKEYKKKREATAPQRHKMKMEKLKIRAEKLRIANQLGIKNPFESNRNNFPNTPFGTKPTPIGIKKPQAKKRKNRKRGFHISY